MEQSTSTEPAGEAGSEPDAPEPSLVEGVRDLLEDGKLALQAEVAFQKSRLAYSGKAGVSLAILAVIAVLFAHGAVMALTVGLLIALATVINPWAAMALVTGLYLVIVMACALLALAKWRLIRAAFTGGEA